MYTPDATQKTAPEAIGRKKAADYAYPVAALAAALILLLTAAV